jgi:hypothetical protein
MYTLVAPHLASPDLLRLGIGMMPQMFSRRGELSGDTHYAVVQTEKVVRAPAGQLSPSQPWPLMAEMPP